MIRTAAPADVPVIHRMIHELAEYEKAAHEAIATEEQLRDALFGEQPAVFGLIAEDDTTGEPVGFALWFLNFSTWRGTHGIYLEDLYVDPTARGGGHGKALLLGSPGSPSSAATPGSSGRCWTGTGPRSTSTRRSARSRWTGGRSTASPARRSPPPAPVDPGALIRRR